MTRPKRTYAEVLAEIDAREPDEWTAAERELVEAMETVDADPGRYEAALKALLDRLDAFRDQDGEIPEYARHSTVTCLEWIRADPERRMAIAVERTWPYSDPA